MVKRNYHDSHHRNIINQNKNDTTTTTPPEPLVAEDDLLASLSESDGNGSERNYQFPVSILRMLPAWEEKCSKETFSNSRKRNERGKLSKFQLMTSILTFRIFYLIVMMLSCHFIPDHNPGDDVLRFDLRLNTNNNNDNNNNIPQTSCFCLAGQSCDLTTWSGLNATVTTVPTKLPNTNVTCVIPSANINSTNDVWSFMLQPFIKWDAARFLHLALNPRMRDPQYNVVDNNNVYVVSEQAHAFLPMFPWILRHTALILHQLVPTVLLPPTYEALLVWSGILFNNLVCLTISTLALYDLTLNILGGHDGMSIISGRQHDVAASVCLVFAIFNPAIVFFATNYSESLFAMMTFMGHACMQHKKRSPDWIRSSSWWSMGILFWMIGSYTRSNGTIHSLALLQDGLAVVCHNYKKLHLSDRNSVSSISHFPSCALPPILSSLIGALLVASPVRYHDWKGYQRHCIETGLQRPAWCLEKDTTVLGPTFSLYRYVQEKHWNVGLFRYYQWKQIPNFILAAPILVLSLGGAIAWIHWSLVTDFGKGKIPFNSLQMICWEWPIQALSDSLGLAKATRTGCSKRMTDYLLKNPRLLGQYAILAILSLVGLLIAHVQISTRLICSSSPAAIWFLTFCLLGGKFRNGQIIGHYVMLYMILGAILHVNFLPWT
jgi:GPI mannosyltransferase 2